MYQVCRKSVNLFEIRYLADKHTGVLTIPVPPAGIYIYIYKLSTYKTQSLLTSATEEPVKLAKSQP